MKMTMMAGGIGEDAGKGSLSDVLKQIVDGSRGFLDENGESIAKYLGGVLTAVGGFFTNFFELGGKIKKLLNGMGVSDEWMARIFLTIGSGILFMISPLTSFALALDTFVKVLNGMEDTWVHRFFGVDKKSKQDALDARVENMLKNDAKAFYQFKQNPYLLGQKGKDAFMVAEQVLNLRRQRTMLKDKQEGRGAFDPIFEPMYNQYFESDMTQDFRKQMSQQWLPQQGASQITVNVEGNLTGDPEEFGNAVGQNLPPSSM